ncbi:hypothetical protein SASPL_139239 [Salvia splendens]|uniref:Uncharacterized protein n=1 Tax=Salvia splendens TaxID=180675 RepID=A0A8X8WYJ5_SALSN|nr:hypothetical protein SASPL_139239 [Salvia splendens]
MKIMSELVQVNANVSDCERSNVYDILLSSFDFRVLMTVIGIPLCLIYSSRLISDTIWSQMVFMLLRKWGCLAFFLSIVATNCLLNGLSKMDCLGKCWEVHREMLRIQIRPNACTVNIFAHILCNEGHTDKVNEFLERMEEEGFDLDIVTYNMLVDGYCKNRRLKDAIYLYNIMCTRGMIPDLIRGGDARCERMLFDMIRKKVSADGFTCWLLIKGHQNLDRMICAVNLVVELVRYGIMVSPDI